MSPLIIALPGNDALAMLLAPRLHAEIGRAEFRRFPDGETYVRLDSNVAGRSVVLVSTLDRPDPKFLSLAFVAATARELGASRVGLIAPYLAYMRQDRRFQSGEAITSRVFARHLSSIVDWLITVDPHLHRIAALSKVYTIPAISVRASPALADWIKETVASPLLIGPDEESAQWVEVVAKSAGVPFIILESIGAATRTWRSPFRTWSAGEDHTPVLVDDIISTARTMIATLGHFAEPG